MEEKNDEGRDKKSDLNPDLIKVLFQESKPYAELLKEHLKSQTSSANKVFYILLLFLGAVIVASTILVFYGKISGDAFMFLVGTVVGYVLGFSLELAKKRWF